MKLFTNFLSLAGAEVISKLFTFAAFAYIGRLAGPIGTGMVEFAGAIILCAGLIVDQGFSPYGIREVAKDRSKTHELAIEIVFTRLVLAVLACVSVVSLALMLDRSPLQIKLLLMYSASVLLTPWLFQWVFQGYERMHVAGAIQVIRQGIFAATIFLFLRTEDHLWLVGVAEMAGVAAAAAFGFWRYYKLVGQWVPIKPVLSRALLRDGFTIGLSQLFWSTKMFGATIFLGFIATGDTGSENLGYFGVSMRILVAMHAFIWLYYVNLLPAMSRLWLTDRARLMVLVKKSMSVTAWLAIGGLVLWILLAQLVITLCYGEKFPHGGSVLAWMGGVWALSGLSGHFRFGLIAIGKQRLETIGSAIGSILALGLLPIGYAHYGAAGAACALVVAEVIVWLYSWAMARQTMLLGGHLRSLIKPVLVSAMVLALSLHFIEATLLRGLLAGVGIVVAAYLSDRSVRTWVHELGFAWIKEPSSAHSI